MLRRKLAEDGLDDVEVTSAGTADYHVGERPHELTRAVGTDLGYEFTTVGAQFRPEDLDEQDLILVMDQGRLVEQGTHDALRKRNGRYAALARSQTEA